jgi:hypothetical protein
MVIIGYADEGERKKEQGARQSKPEAREGPGALFKS